MNSDEIKFDDEVQYRQPVRMTRPDRDRNWTCIAYEVPRPGDMPIYLERKPADAIERHALRDVSVELGGILLGRECVDEASGEPFVIVTESLEAKHYENTQASFTYTHDSWQEITRERDRLYPDLDIVGWYHTHPDFGIFLSGHDLFIHHNFFNQPLQVAYVVDPIRQTRGFFWWKNGGVEQVGGYYLIAPRDQRAALTRLVNDLEGIPNDQSGGGGGSGLSPRLEAELINMLTRPPHYATQSAQDRGQSMAMASFAGLLIGLFVCAGALWINGLNSQIGDQAKHIAALTEKLEKNTEVQRLTLDVLATKGEPGTKGEDVFSRAHRDAVAKRAELETRVTNLTILNERLASEDKDLRTDLNKAAREIQSFKDAGDIKKTQTDLETANTKIADLTGKLEAKSELINAADEKKGAEILSKAKWTLYIAVGGWTIAALLGGAMLLMWVNGYLLLPAGEGPIPPAGPPSMGGSETHVIQ